MDQSPDNNRRLKITTQAQLVAFGVRYHDLDDVDAYISEHRFRHLQTQDETIKGFWIEGDEIRDDGRLGGGRTSARSGAGDSPESRKRRLPLKTPMLPAFPKCTTASAARPPLDAIPLLAKMTEFNVVCNSYDHQDNLKQWLYEMPKLQTLHVRCKHDDSDPNTGRRYAPEANGVAVSLVKTLTYQFRNYPLRQIYLDDVVLKPYALLRMVMKRQKLGCSIPKIQVRAPAMPWTECTALHKLVDFDHIRTHAKYGERFDDADCTCRCECEGACVMSKEDASRGEYALEDIPGQYPPTAESRESQVQPKIGIAERLDGIAERLERLGLDRSRQRYIYLKLKELRMTRTGFEALDADFHKHAKIMLDALGV